jgi:rRNA-processing protein FCF1
MTEKILLDTNFLVAPFQFSFDIFEELEEMYPYAEICTIEDAVQEAKSIKGGKFKDLVPQIIESEDISVYETEGEGEVDDLLVDISDDFIIATNDKELKKRIKDQGRPVIIIRGKDHLEIKNNSSDL